MTDNEQRLRYYSSDRSIYPQSYRLTKMNTRTNSFSSNSNSTLIVPAITLNNREKLIYQSLGNDNDIQKLNRFNYATSTTRSASISNLEIENNNQHCKQTFFPKLKPRSNSTVKTIPIFTARSTSLNLDDRNAMPILRSSIKPISLSLRNDSQSKLSFKSTENHSNIKSLKHAHHREE